MNDCDVTTLAYVSAAVIRSDYVLHGTEPYIPEVSVIQQMIQFAGLIDDAWDSIPEYVRDSNTKPWDSCILPMLVENFFQSDYSTAFSDIRDAIIDIMLDNWSQEDLIAFIKIHHSRGQ